LPIYEYRCRACGGIGEFLVGGGQRPSIVCPACGSLEMEKILSPASLLDRSRERNPGHTCCGREERCDTAPCSEGSGCRRD
jgi:putative FmdB family regulatory protein